MPLRTQDQTTLATPFVLEAAGQRCILTTPLLYPGGTILENADLSLEIDRRIRLMRACLKIVRPGVVLWDAPLSLKVRMLR